MKKTIYLFAFCFLLSAFYIKAQETQSSVADFPWFEGFESPTFPPANWSILHLEGTKTWEKGVYYCHSGTGSALHDWALPVQKTALITPAITLPAFGEPVLDFWSRFQLVGYKKCSVLISTTVNNDLNAFTEVKVLAGDEIQIAVWKNISISLSDFLGQTIYIAFLYDNNDGPQWYIDDVTVSHFDSYIDMQALSLSPKTGEYAVLHTNDPIKVRLKNNGGNPASGFGLQLWHNGTLVTTETFSGSIPSLGVTEYTFNASLNLTAQGTHMIKVVVLMPDDQVPENDVVTSSVTNLGCSVVNTFPFFEGFENNGLNFPTCWTHEQISGDRPWRIMNTAYANGIPGLEPKTAFEGDYKAVFYESGHIAKLITPPMNLGSLDNPLLKFHHIQQRYVNDLDSLKIYYKPSLWAEWVFLEKYTSIINEWTERVIPLPNPSNEYYIAFEAYGEYGHSVQVDNVIVGHFFNTDIAVQAIAPNGVHLGLSDQQTITATIKNNGRNSVTDFDLSLFCNGTFVTTEIFTGTIPSMGEANYNFNAKLDLSISGYYTITVEANLVGDEVLENNELTVFVKNLVCDAITFPYDEGFEEEIFPPYCWLNTGTQWEKMNYDAHTGMSRARHKWWDGTQDGWLISPKFSIPAGGNYMLEFWSDVYENRFYTYSGVWISTTNTNISSFTEVHELTYDERPESEWVRIEIPLSTYAGQNIYIAFRYKTYGNDTGHIWSLDDIRVFNLDTFIDAELVEITTPSNLGINLTNAEPVTVKIKNNGGDPLSGFQLRLELNGTVVATENFTGFITSLSSVNYTFTRKLDLSAEGVYTLKVTVIADGDMEPNNDSKTKTVENRICPPITSFPWYGEFQGSAAGEIAHCWVNTDGDGDTKKWWSLENNGAYYALSESYDAVYEFPLSPDNWLMTPPLVLHQNGNANLSFKVGAANSYEWGAENYSILVSTTGVNPSNFITIHTELLNPAYYTEQLTGVLAGYGVKKVNLSLSAFQGKTVHIAFRHWDCTEQDMLILSDIIVNEFLAIEDESANKSMIAWVLGNRLNVTGINIGDQLSLFSVTGQLIHQVVVDHEIMKITLNTRGFYVVQSGNKVAKVAY